jgi:hypothetical protein
LNLKFKNLFFSKRNLLAAVVLFLVLRFIVSIFFIQEFNSIEDYMIAENIVSGNGYELFAHAGPTAIKAPVYPLFLSLFIIIFGTSAKLFVVLFQHLLISLVPFLLIELSERMNRPKYGYVAGWLFLIHPSYFYYPNVLEVTNIFVPFCILTIIFIIKSFSSSGFKNILIASVLSGILILIQPLVMLPLACVLIIFLIKKKIKYALIMFSVVVIILSPWTIRNYIQFDSLIITKSPFWMNFYVGWLPSHHGNPRYDVISEEDKLEIDSLLKSGLNDIEMEKYYKMTFLKYFNEHTILYFEKTIYQMASYWYITPRYFNDNSISFLMVRKVPVIALNILFIVGMIALFRKDKEFAWSILLFLGYFSLIYGFTHIANIRFKLDIEWLEFFAVAALFIPKRAGEIK